MSAQQLVLTAIGPDRPGIVKEITSIIHRAGGNLEDSRMAVLAGDFALIVLFSGSQESVDKIQSACRPLETKLDFKIQFKPASTQATVPVQAAYLLQATGVDQPGIIHMVSTILADHDVNVKSLDTTLTPAAFQGNPMFTFRAEIQIQDKSVLDKVFRNLDNVCDELDLSYDIDPV